MLYPFNQVCLICFSFFLVNQIFEPALAPENFFFISAASSNLISLKIGSGLPIL